MKKSLGLALSFLICGAVVILAKAEPKNVQPAWSATQAYKALLQKIEPLVKEQKLQAALTLANEEASRITDPLDQARIMTKISQLEIGLHGTETAVKSLRQKKWPNDDRAQTLLHIFYAFNLQQYAHSYSWEISQRTKISGKQADPTMINLKALTGPEIFNEAITSLSAIWPLREKLGLDSKAALTDFITPNTFPEGVRDSFRESYSMLFVRLLNDSAGWSPEQSNDLFRLNLQTLLDRNDFQAVDLKDSLTHPLEKIAKILTDLKSWHGRNNKKDAALDIELELLKIFHQRFTHEKDREAIQQRLMNLLSGPAEKTPWYSMGAATLAEFWMNDSFPESPAKAMAIAKKGEAAFPESLGAKYCRDLIKRIKAPHFELQAMSLDGPNRRSLGLDYKNINKIHFFGFKYDFKRFLENNQDYSHYPGHRELAAIWKSKPTLRWSIDLPTTSDYNIHKAYITPPPHDPGFYIIVAAMEPHLSPRDNIVRSVMVFFSDLVITQTHQKGQTAFQIRNGETGQLEKGVTLLIYRFNYGQKNTLEATLTTDIEGRAVFPLNSNNHRHQQFGVLAEMRNNLTFADFNTFSWGENQRQQTILYTDRSIYRPQQKLMWKILSYRSENEVGKFQLNANSQEVVTLKDMNGQVVESKTVRTDEFGAAWGEFLIPAGRTLGIWSLGTSHGTQSVRVEEYKRPTFEVQWKEQKNSLRLNHPADVIGEARYYFGAPLTSGRVRYTVARSLVFPWWCFWGYFDFRNLQSSQVIAAAEAKIENDGTFKIQFKPEIDGRESSLREIKYNFVVNAEVLDDGGETRVAQKTIVLSHQAIEASLSLFGGFVLEDKPFEVVLRRTQISGDPAPGPGVWKLVKLKEPTVVQMPAEDPVPHFLESVVAQGLRLPDDTKKARWSPSYNWRLLVRDWPEAEKISKDFIETDKKGGAVIRLPKLAAGAYRLVYHTKDSFGVSAEAQTEFFVVNDKYKPQLPGLFLISQTQAKVGEVIDLWMPSGLSNQTIIFEAFQDGRFFERRVLNSNRDLPLMRWPIKESMRGGIAFSVRLLRDYQAIDFAHSVFVPWDNKEIAIEFASFRDKLRPGQGETWTVKLTGPEKAKVSQGSVQLLAYMYDRSLDQLVPHLSSSLLSIYPVRHGLPYSLTGLGLAPTGVLNSSFRVSTKFSPPKEDHLIFLSNYGIGGPGRRGFGLKGMVQGISSEMFAERAMEVRSDSGDMLSPNSQETKAEQRPREKEMDKLKVMDGKSHDSSEVTAGGTELRTNFSETAFFYPNLLSGKDGEVEIKFKVPEAVTSWTLWLQGLTRDLKSATASRQAETVKELLIRPYLPRFLREGDRAQLRFVLNNTSDKAISGQVRVELLDEDGKTDLASKFKVIATNLSKQFRLEAGRSLTHEIELTAPVGLGNLVVRAMAKAGNLSDGEQRSLPILPGRFHLAQSKFVTLKNTQAKALEFSELRSSSDPSLVSEKMTIQIDAQLFYSVLSALPYLINYPYECIEQTLNRFVSTGILSSLYGKFPAIEKVSKELSIRKTQFERFDEVDANRRMALEETPWLNRAKGGRESSDVLINVLDSKIAAQQRSESLSKLEKAQTSLGGFPWFGGGPPSPYMTLYVVYGFSKALEFGVDIPKAIVQKAWSYLHRHYLDEDVRHCLRGDSCWQFLTFLNYVLSNYPDKDWGQKVFTEDERKAMLDLSFKHWKEHSPYLKGYLALTLMRIGRQKDAHLVWTSVMDSAKFSEEEGTHWVREDRSWLWYNDTIETHAFALRTLMELGIDKIKQEGLVQWLFLNKKMNHWQSTRSTAEVIYSLAHYLSKANQLGIREAVNIKIGSEKAINLDFSPEKYTGHKNQIVFEGSKVNLGLMPITVQKSTPGFMFASAHWQYSTDKLPQAAIGDFLSVERKYFIRDRTQKTVVLHPLDEGHEIRVGDEIEVQLSLKSKHPVDYVHLRDPRGAGFEPVAGTSQHKWDLGLAWYEEIRDSGANFFFERLPQGQFTFKYRIRATTEGEFKVSPAMVQPMYATEFAAFSAGHRIRITKEK